MHTVSRPYLASVGNGIPDATVEGSALCDDGPRSLLQVCSCVAHLFFYCGSVGRVTLWATTEAEGYMGDGAVFVCTSTVMATQRETMGTRNAVTA